MRVSSACASLLVVLGGCYAGARATRDVNESWRGRTRRQLEGRWGRPGAERQLADGTALTWSFTRAHVILPSAHAELTIQPGYFEGEAAVQPGAVWSTTTAATALISPGGSDRVVRVDGASLRWGPPNDVNLRWGPILGLHVGMGSLDDASSPLPSGGLYIGGMLTRTLGLVGCFSMVSGTGDEGSAMGFAWGMAPQWWPTTRWSLRAGPAMVLDLDPGFTDPKLRPGLTGSASYAWVKVGRFALDLRLDLVGSPAGAFGSLGVGVNLN